MEGFCRACLIKYDEASDLLQYTEKNRRLFVYSTGLQVKRNDAFTFQLCKDCYINMKTSSKFKKQCRTSEKRFKSYLALKQTGSDMDFCTYLKNDDAWSLRLPMPSGNSTPVHQKVKEDDNDSTCTSIRNFMTDMLQAEEIPDTEARIIREVIEEEADVLDDSLDSHWLQDDVSIDTDFRLDFSFSPFSTPKSVANDHCYTPRKDDIHFLEPSINTKQKHVYVPTKTKGIDLLSEKNIPNHQTNQNETNKYFNGIIIQDAETINNHVKFCKAENGIALKSECIIDGNIDDYNIITNVVDNSFIGKVQDYTIDRNIENALADMSNREISLDDLLKTPPVHLAPSPTITNILFGDKLDKKRGCSTPKTGQWIENYNDVQGDTNILEDFLHGEDKDGITGDPYDEQIDDTKSEELSNNVNESKYNQQILIEELKDESDNLLKEVDQQTESNHNQQLHTEILIDSLKEETADDPLKEVGQQNGSNYNQHLHTELLIDELKEEIADDPLKEVDQQNEVADVEGKTKIKRVSLSAIAEDCDIEKFYCKLCEKQMNNMKAIKMHFARVHKTRLVLARFKKRICDLCGEEKNMSSYNFKRHRELHFDRLIVECDICNRKLCGLANLRTHMKKNHTPNTEKTNKPTRYVCPMCGMQFVSRAAYITHHQRHFGIKNHTCAVCQKGFHSKADLNKHMTTHSDARPFACSMCPLRFGRRDVLTRHLKTHQADRYECDKCRIKFNDKYKLRKHVNKKCPALKPKKVKTLKALEKKKPKRSRKKSVSADQMKIER